MVTDELLAQGAVGLDPHHPDDATPGALHGRRLCATHDVRAHGPGTGTKRFHHPVGEIVLAYEELAITAEPGLVQVDNSAEPGTMPPSALGCLPRGPGRSKRAVPHDPHSSKQATRRPRVVHDADTSTGAAANTAWAEGTTVPPVDAASVGDPLRQARSGPGALRSEG